MSSCHQAHNIPWSYLVDNLEYREDGRLMVVTRDMHKKQPRSRHGKHAQYLKEIAVKELEIAKRIRYFASRFAKAIAEFALTERNKEKYSEQRLKSMSKIYADEECEDEGFLRPGERQSLSYWKPLFDAENYYGIYSEFTSELFRKDLLHSILYMARNGLTLEKSWSYYNSNVCYGIIQDTLEVYLHLNVMIGTGIIANPSKWYVQCKDFFSWRVNDELNRSARGELLYGRVSNLNFLLPFFEKDREFQDLSTRKELLNLLFRRLYLYDMAMREGGVEWNWEKEICKFLSNTFWIKWEEYWLRLEEQWTQGRG
ncbi:hypothetical protein O6H91_13G088000 [Diphasiastrum complanatum]|uniref:Uncharacterized protein n=1 Tax=Diphasiastrum complanatum TaxID=34168 RepID=A0ACC2BWY8_DIPCM|nr:hypothetical protein O6H91_13G088000 [Diphasiastrum complanatum]